MILISFIKRNILLYFRDRISVFFSLLSTLIVLTLMIAFLGQGNIDSTIQVLGTGLKYEAVHASSLIIIWTIAGILVVNAVSIWLRSSALFSLSNIKLVTSVIFP